ncbi:MAG: hypothetical protein J0M12_10425 [Deltaproteobacteria bacterium]|nr:hypothetical protein [Deltaproteobacteria bacterium]
MLPVKDSYDEIFKIEMDGWCYGISNYPGEIFPGLVHRVIKELGPSFREAIEHNVVFNVIETAQKFSKAAKYLINDKEIAFSILSTLPNPSVLDEDGQFIMAQLIDQVERAYGGALERLQKKWGWERRQAA